MSRFKNEPIAGPIPLWQKAVATLLALTFCYGAVIFLANQTLELGKQVSASQTDHETLSMLRGILDKAAGK